MAKVMVLALAIGLAGLGTLALRREHRPVDWLLVVGWLLIGIGIGLSAGRV